MKSEIKKILKLDPHDGQFNYLGRWVNKDTFRVFVYNAKNESKLANSYKEYESLIETKAWFAEKVDASTDRKPKDDIIRPIGK